MGNTVLALWTLGGQRTKEMRLNPQESGGGIIEMFEARVRQSYSYATIFYRQCFSMGIIFTIVYCVFAKT